MTVKLSINNIKNTAFLFSRYKLYIDFIERLYLYSITITGSIPLLVHYLCIYYYHWANTSAGGLLLFFFTITGPISLLVDNLCFIIITGSIPLLLDYSCFYYYHWVDTSADGLSMFLLLSLG